MVSRTSEYALRAAVHLADHPAQPRTGAQIAAETRTPPVYLSKVLRDLVRAGLVRSRPGLHGGFTLARLPSQITVLEVVSAVDSIVRGKRSPGPESHSLSLLKRRLDEAEAMVENAFRETTLAELQSTPMHPGLCPSPAPLGAALALD